MSYQEIHAVAVRLDKLLSRRRWLLSEGFDCAEINMDIAALREMLRLIEQDEVEPRRWLQ